MTLIEYLDGMRAATTAAELEAAIQARRKAKFVHPFHGPKWKKICDARIEAGRRICAAHAEGQFVPHFAGGRNRKLTVCGKTYGVGRGQNSAGVRYCWHYAKEWAWSVLQENGFSKRAAFMIWDTAFDYPHRALAIIAAARAGKLPDPRFHRLIPHSRSYTTGEPVRVNRDSEAKERAHRPCKCGGWLWDWGCGWNGYANFINWHCDSCPRVYTEYVTNDRLTEVRQSPRAA